MVCPEFPSVRERTRELTCDLFIVWVQVYELRVGLSSCLAKMNVPIVNFGGTTTDNTTTRTAATAGAAATTAVSAAKTVSIPIKMSMDRHSCICIDSPNKI